MTDLRFIELLTKELTEELTPVEKDELSFLSQQNSMYSWQRKVIKEYWAEKSEYSENAANFKKIIDAIGVIEQSPSDDNVVNLPIDNKRDSFKIWQAIKYIAAVAIIGTAVYLWYLSANPVNDTVILASNWHHKVVAQKTKQRLVLSDGTTVVLNSGTKFSYPTIFGSKNREVYLNGEAFFEVTKDRKHPFVIHTNKMNVRVLGTAFNIKSYDDESDSETSLIRGSIEVTLNDRKSDRIILKPKEKLIVHNNLTSIQSQINTGKANINSAGKGPLYSLTNLTYLPDVDSNAVETLWLKNKLVFNNDDFESVAANMYRWFGVKIIFKNNELKQLKLSGTFETETPEQVLEALQLAGGFHYKKQNSTFYISK